MLTIEIWYLYPKSIIPIVTNFRKKSKSRNLGPKISRETFRMYKRTRLKKFI